MTFPGTYADNHVRYFLTRNLIMLGVSFLRGSKSTATVIATYEINNTTLNMTTAMEQ